MDGRKRETTQPGFNQAWSANQGTADQEGYTSYEYFAYEHHISRAQFGRYEKGEDLRYTSLLKVIRALEISLSEFFNEGFE